MSSNLYAASRQWSERPDDERFWTLADMLAATRAHRDSAYEGIVPVNSLSVRVDPQDSNELQVFRDANKPARFTHWAFGQISQRIGAPAEYLRKLPADLAVTNLNYGLKTLGSDGANLLIHKNGGNVLRSINSDKYARIWNCDALNRLVGFEQHGWRVPPARPARANQSGSRPATEKDVLEMRTGNGGLSINVGDMIAPAGLYASDHDMFVFMVNEKNRINDGSDGGLSRGFFLTNSEVGGCALKLTTFLYRHVCGNHIVWSASEVQQIKIVHRGQANNRFRSQMTMELRKFAEASASEDEAKITTAKRFKIGDNKDSVLDVLFKNLRGDVSRKVLDASYDLAALTSNYDKTIDPNTAWGMTQGMTAHSQTVPYADERAKIDKAGAKVLSLAF